MIETLNAITHAIKLLENRKADAISRFKIFTIIKSQFVGFIFGVIASLIASFIFISILKPTNCNNNVNKKPKINQTTKTNTKANIKTQKTKFSKP